MSARSFDRSQSVSSKLLVEVPKPTESGMGGSFPTAFVDRDGVINVGRVGYVRSWEQFAFLPHALAGLALLARSSRRVVVITNQSVVNRGLLTAAAIYACPHRPDEGCGCRKPAPGLLLAAARDFNLSLGDVVFVGDQLTDLDAARRAGCRSILVTSGENTAEPHPGLPDGCDAVVPDRTRSEGYGSAIEQSDTATSPLKYHTMPVLQGPARRLDAET